MHACEARGRGTGHAEPQPPLLPGTRRAHRTHTRFEAQSKPPRPQGRPASSADCHISSSKQRDRTDQASVSLPPGPHALLQHLPDRSPLPPSPAFTTRSPPFPSRTFYRERTQNTTGACCPRCRAPTFGCEMLGKETEVHGHRGRANSYWTARFKGTTFILCDFYSNSIKHQRAEEGWGEAGPGPRPGHQSQAPPSSQEHPAQ